MKIFPVIAFALVLAGWPISARAQAPSTTPIVFSLRSIRMSESGAIVESVHYDLTGDISSSGVGEVFECGDPFLINLFCPTGDRDQLVNLPDDLQGQLASILTENNIRKGSIPSTKQTVDLMLTITGPGDPVVDIHYDIRTRQMSAIARVGTLDPNDNTCVTNTGWTYCWKLDVNVCGGAPSCSDGTNVVCQGAPCTTGTTANPACSNVPGTVTCASGFSCVATPRNVPELQNGIDDDCDGLVDECNDAKPIECTAVLRACPAQPGSRSCAAANAFPGPCVPVDADNPNVCQESCPGVINVQNVVELREAIAQAALTPCKDVIVLAPGFYDVTSPLAIDDSLEIRGSGSSFDCQGISLDTALATQTLDDGLGSLRCDGDNGENPEATVIRNVVLPTGGSDDYFQVMRIGAQSRAPEVTLRHLTISGGFGSKEASPGTGIFANGESRLKLFNVIVEDNEARGPTAGLVHVGTSARYPITPTFVMVNSTVRRNLSTTPPLGNGIGVQGNGGGISVSGVSFILRSTINGNAGIRGAGLFALGTLHLYNSTVSGNLAGQGGGGIYFAGGILNVTDSGLLELRSDTITNNYAQWFRDQPDIRKDGAGVLAVGASQVELYGNLIANNVECQGDFRGKNGVNCSFAEGATGQSLGGNVGSADCGFLGNLLLPATSTPTSDKVVSLGYLRDPKDPTQLQFPNPFGTAIDTLCAMGAASSIVGGGPFTSAAQRQAFPSMPTGADEVFDTMSQQRMVLVGPLASQGGPTQTHSLAAMSPAIGAAKSSADPGIVSDPFPSAGPTCPSADQRGFQVAAGAHPAVCDSGSFQSLATSPLSAFELSEQMGRFFGDADNDGIADAIDDAPQSASTVFADLGSNGVTRGRILDPGAQILRLFDAFPNPEQGVLVLALESGGTTPARIDACNGTVQMEIQPGDKRVISCPRQPDLCVLASEKLTVGDRVQLNVEGVLAREVTFGPSSLGSSLFGVSCVGLRQSHIDRDVVSAGFVSGSAQSSIGGAVTENAYLLARPLASEPVEIGTSDVTLLHDQVRSLLPGAYRNLVLGDRATLSLTTGRYSFDKIHLGNDTHVTLDGVVWVKAQSEFSVGDRTHVTDPKGAPAPGDLTEWYTNAADVSIGLDVLWSGTLVAPSARVVVRDRASLDGCLAASRIEIGNDASVVARRLLPARVSTSYATPAPDTTKPTVIAPPNKTITTCVNANIGQATATDLCDQPVPASSIRNDAPAHFPLGTTKVTWSSTDTSGNVGTATQLVTAVLADDPSCCPIGTKVIVGTNNSEQLNGTAGSDCIVGRGGNDTINSFGGVDYISGGAGNDTIAAGDGDDFVWGGDGDDTIDSGPGNDFVDGGNGTDTCTGGTGTNAMTHCEVVAFCNAACCPSNSCVFP